MKLKTDPFFFDQENKEKREHIPLLIGCSGGAGHNSAIEAIKAFLIQKEYVKENDLPYYTPVDAKNRERTSDIRKIDAGSMVANASLFGPAVRSGFDKLKIPNLPSMDQIQSEIARLNNEQAKKGSRHYIDMLLDIFPSGYYHAAIWNILQRQDKTNELKKTIDYQQREDNKNYSVVREYFYNKLKCFSYTEVISTQVMALPALCDAVASYNKDSKNNIKIHQYLTDLPTSGAIHFFKTLSALTEEQRRHVIVYGVNLEEDFSGLPDGMIKGFSALINIDFLDNPMVRSGFKNMNLNSNNKFLIQQRTGEKDQEIIINDGENIASIMLGSQAGEDTIGYVEKLVATSKYDKIFVFGGRAPHLERKIDDKTGKVILLHHQDDSHSAYIRARSNLAIIRGGGLTVMEEMAMYPAFHSDKMILFHGRRGDNGEFTSGIQWEDGNVDKVIGKLSGKLKKVAHTCVAEVTDEITVRFFGALNDVDVDNKNRIGLLLLAINGIRTNTRFMRSFISILDKLHFDLKSAKTKSESKSVIEDKLADLTIDLISDLKNTPDNTESIKCYQRQCNEIAGSYRFKKVLNLVIAVAVGAVVGAIIGASVGLLVGAWSGPGAFATGVWGLLSGVYLGAIVGLSVGSSASLAFSYRSGGLLFKPSPLAGDTENVAHSYLQKLGLRKVSE